MAKLSKVLATPFSGATEPLIVPLDDEPEGGEVLTLKVRPAGVSSLFLMSDTITRALSGAEDDAEALEAYRGVLIDALSDLVAESDLEDDETGEVVQFTAEGLAEYSTVEVQKIFTLIAGALSEAPFVRALQAGRSKPGQKPGRPSKKR